MEVTDKLKSLFTSIADNSGGFIYIAKNEEDKSTKKELAAATFLKLHHERLGRDLELYAFMAKAAHIEVMLVQVLEEVLLPIKHEGLTGSYKAASDIMKAWGSEVFDSNMVDAWQDLF